MPIEPIPSAEYPTHARRPGFSVLDTSLTSTLLGEKPSHWRVALREIVDGIASHGTFNMLLSDGSALYTHCSTNLYYIVRQHPFAKAKLSDEDLSVDFSEVTTTNDRVAVIVTQPLTDNEVWTQYQTGEMKVFVDGAVVE